MQNAKTPGTGDRFKLLLSDGEAQHASMLTTQLAHVADSGELQEGCCLQVLEALANDVHGKR